LPEKNQNAGQPRVANESKLFHNQTISEQHNNIMNSKRMSMGEIIKNKVFEFGAKVSFFNYFLGPTEISKSMKSPQDIFSLW